MFCDERVSVSDCRSGGSAASHVSKNLFTVDVTQLGVIRRRWWLPAAANHGRDSAVESQASKCEALSTHGASSTSATLGHGAQSALNDDGTLSRLRRSLPGRRLQKLCPLLVM